MKYIFQFLFILIIFIIITIILISIFMWMFEQFGHSEHESEIYAIGLYALLFCIIYSILSR